MSRPGGWLAAGLLISLVLGCRENRDTRPAEPRPETLLAYRGEWTPAPWLAGANRVVAARGEASPWIAAAGPGWLRVMTVSGESVAEAREPGQAQALELLDVRGDARPELIVGRGESVAARGAPPSVVVYDLPSLAQPERIPLPPTPRAQVVGIVPAGGARGRLFVAAYESRFSAGVIVAERSPNGRWSTRRITSVRVPGGIASLPSSAPGADHDLAVAQVYGKPAADGTPTDGGVAVVGATTTVPVPSRRGARAVRSVDGDEPMLVFADGWHHEYRRRGEARITTSRLVAGAWTSRVRVWVADRYGYDRLRLGDLAGDGTVDIVAAGNNGPAVVVPLRGDGAGQGRHLGSGDVVDAYPANLDGDSGDEVILLGSVPGIFDPR